MSDASQYQYGFVLGVPIVSVLAVALFGVPMFDGNDDTGLAMVGAGFGLAVEPEPHLIFSHYGYGLLLNLVSRLAGAHAHGWITLAVVGLSMGLFVRALCGRTAPGYVIAAALVIAGAGIFTRALLAPQFTLTSAILFGSAIACWMVATSDERRSWPLMLAVYGAIALSFLIRPAAALLGLIVTGFALVWLAFFGPTEDRKPARHLLITLGAIALTSYVTDVSAYAFSAEWRDALEYNQLRSLFNDYFRIPWIEGAPEYQKVGWSANDYSMFMQWYALHPIFDYENIKFLAQTLTQNAPLLVFSGVPLWLMAPLEFPTLGLLLAVQFLLCLSLSRHRIVGLLMLLGFSCVILISAVTGRPPLFRVWFAAIAVAILCTLPLVATAWRPRLVHKAIIALAVGIAILVGSRTIEVNRETIGKAAQYRAALAEAMPYLTGTIVSWGAHLAWEWLITPTTIHAPVAGKTIPSIGLYTKMPIMQATLRHIGIADLGTTLCTQTDVRLVATERFVRDFETFCDEHYGVRPIYVEVFYHFPTRIYMPLLWLPN